MAAILGVALIGTAIALWGIEAQDRLSSDLYDVRDPALDASNSAIEEQAQWVLDILNGAEVTAAEVRGRFSPELNALVPTEGLLNDVELLVVDGPYSFRGFEIDQAPSLLTMETIDADGMGLTLTIGTDSVGRIDGLLLAPGEADRGPMTVVTATLHLVAGWGLLVSGAVVWLVRHRRGAGMLLLGAGIAWLAQMLELADLSLLYTLGLVSAPVGAVLVVAAVLSMTPGGTAANDARSALVAAVVAALGAVAPLLTIDTRKSSLPRQLLATGHDRSSAETLAVLGNLVAIAAALLFAVVVWRRFVRGTGIGQQLRAVMALAATVMVVAVVTLAGWAMSSRSFDLSTSPWLSMALLAVPIGLAFVISGENRTALGGVASMVVDVGQGPTRSGLESSLAQALRDPSLALAFWSPERSEYVNSMGQTASIEPSDGRAVTLLGSTEDPVGAVLHDAELLAEPDRVRAATAAARIAIENERSQALAASRLRASRLRIVESAEEARRQVERDLHDGAQQRLIALQLAVKLEQQRVESGEAVDPAFLSRLGSELSDAINELRELGRGLRPSALDHGLRAAVESLAERSPLPVVVDVTDDPVPGWAESAAYFVVNEAVTNAVRHSGSDHVRVKVARSVDALTVVVADDGVGGARQGSGSGLQSLEDRVLALDGEWSVQSTTGEGTTIMARLPVVSVAPRSERSQGLGS